MLDKSFDPDAPIIVIGAAGVDIVGQVNSPLQEKSSSPAEIRSSFGGTARNVAENLARLGQPTVLITALGEDHNGDQLLNHAIDVGIDTSYILRTEEWPTSTYIAALDKDRRLLYALDDMRALNIILPAYVRSLYQLFKTANAVFIDANLSPRVIKSIISHAKKADVPVCGDPTSLALASKLMPHLTDLSLITANHQETETLTGETFAIQDHEKAGLAARKLVNAGVDFAIVTLAEYGVCYASQESIGHIPALRTDITDPTGAGDALIAAVLFALINDVPPDEAVRLGVSAASITLRYPGAVYPNLSLEMLYDNLTI